MQTGENEQGLRKILDMTRLMGVMVLLLHFYFVCYTAFQRWSLCTEITDRLLFHITKTGLFHPFSKSKLIALGLLVISLLGVQGKKDQQLSYQKGITYLLIGVFLYFLSSSIFYVNIESSSLALLYIGITALGFILFLTGGTLLSRVIQLHLAGDVFNTLNETFPQEERLIPNEYSIHLPARYNFRGKWRNSWINLINPFRGLLVMGTPGSGKSYFVIQHVIRQHLQKGFSMFVYDFKFDDLTRITYNYFLKNKKAYEVTPSFYVINFDDLSRSHRCNPLHPSTLKDITDAAESSRTLMLGLNREWIEKGGDFFVESPINFVTALIWYLRCYKDGKYCTLPHLIELAQVDYQKLFSVLRTEPQIEVLINPFVSAYQNEAREQLEGQIASAKISLARLVAPSLYYVLSGNDFTLDINNADDPKIVCMGNNPQKSSTYGAVLSLYITSLTRLVNRKGGRKCSLVLDEFPTIYFHGKDGLLATGRSNMIATTLAIQDSSQLKVHYGKDASEVILNTIGNLISGQVSGESAKSLSERFGKILQQRESVSTSSRDTSISHSKQLEMAVPASTISSLSSGEFVGIVADNPDQIITRKTFHAQLVNDHKNLAKERVMFQPLPVLREVTNQMVLDNYLRIKKDTIELIQVETERMMNTPSLESLIIRR